MIKIAYVINYINQNGPSNVVLNIIENLDKTKFDISLITLFQENSSEILQKLRTQNIAVYECVSLNRLQCLCGKSKEFDDIVEQKRYDVLHAHGLIPDILVARLKISVKKITTLHNNMFEDYLDSYGYFKSKIFIQMHLMALKKMNVSVCCSKSVYDVMKHNVGHITYVRNGIEPLKPKCLINRKGLEIPEDSFVFLYAGALNTGKHIVWLIQKFVECHRQNEFLLVLGHGEKEEECRKIADNHVKLLGFQGNVADYMDISNVYVSASKSEGFSISVLEALSCGCALFLSDIPSHREVVQIDDKTYMGEVFGKNDFLEKLECIRTHELNKENIKNLQQSELSARKMAEEYEKIYEG